MAFRQTYETVTMPIIVSSPEDEIITKILAVWSQHLPTSLAPSGVAVCIKLRIASRTDGGYFRFPVMRFDGLTGEFVDRVASPDGVGFNAAIDHIWELPGNTLDDPAVVHGRLIVSNNLDVFAYTPEDYNAFGPTIFPPTGYWGGTANSEDSFIYDPVSDLYVANTSLVGAQELGVYVASTGADTGVQFGVAGVNHLVGLDPPQGLSVSDSGVVTIFNYQIGQIMNISAMPTWDVAEGALPSTRAYGYDRYNHRLLLADLTDQTAGFESTIIVRGYSPITIGWDIMPPVATREPRVNGVTKIFTRVIGKNGEGIGNVKVTFADEGVGDVVPVDVITDTYGYAVAEYDGLAVGGAETITVSTETIDALFGPGGTQGAGGGLGAWIPDPHLDFNGQINNADVSALIPEQIDWDLGTDGSPDFFGVSGNVSVTRTLRTSSAECRIEIGETGETSTAANGTFGGLITLSDYIDVRRVGQEQEFYTGVWIQFPTGFDFTTTSDGLLLFTVRHTLNGADETVVEIRMKHDGGTTHQGWSLAWPDEIVTDTRHDFVADSSGLISDDTWHFVQYYCRAQSSIFGNFQRLWIDDILLWELVETAARHLETAGGGTLVDFTANERIRTMTGSGSKIDEVQVLKNWEGGAPATQSCYIGNVVWSRGVGLPNDSDGNTYIPVVYAEAL